MDYNGLKFIKMKALRDLRKTEFFPLAGILLFILAFLDCRPKASSKAAQSSVEEDQATESRLVLQIEDVQYFEGDFMRYIRGAAGDAAVDLEPAALSLLFDEFVERKLLLQAALKKGVTLSSAEKEEYLGKTNYEAWTKEERQSLTEADSGPLYDKLIVEKYISDLVKGARVDDGEVERYYELHKSEFYLPDRVKVSQILLSTEAKAIDVWEKVRSASEEEFRAAAAAESIGPEASQGGEMGVFHSGQLPPEMETVVFSLQEGEVSPVIESSYGFHIFRLDQKLQPEWISLAEASASIKIKILDQKVKQVISHHLRELQETMEWTIFSENLSFPYQRNEG